MDEDNSNSLFSSNLTSLGNPNFSSSDHQLMLDDSLQNESSQRNGNVDENNGNANTNFENYSISFMTTNSILNRKQQFWSRFNSFERIQFVIIAALVAIIFVMLVLLLIQPNPMLQVHLTNKTNRSSE